MRQGYVVIVAAVAVLILPGPHAAAQDVADRADGDTADAVDADAADAASESVGTADEPAERPVTFSLGSGVRYDSNVAVLELDTSSNAGDAAASFELGVNYDKPDEGVFDFRTGYNFSQTRHEDFEAFDVGIHRGSATFAWDLEGVDTGASLHYAYAELDGEEFLVLEQFSPYIQKLMSERLFLRFALAHTEKTFAGNPGRDADAATLSSDAYVFLNGLTTYMIFGHRYNDEDALDNQFDYSGHELKVQLNRRFEAGSRTLTFKTYLRAETRDYSYPTLSIGEQREDDRYQFEALAELPLGERVLATFSYRHADNQSNLPSLDFVENVYSVEFSADF